MGNGHDWRGGTIAESVDRLGARHVLPLSCLIEVLLEFQVCVTRRIVCSRLSGEGGLVPARIDLSSFPRFPQYHTTNTTFLEINIHSFSLLSLIIITSIRKSVWTLPLNC